MQYLCNKHGLDQFYPKEPGTARHDRQRHVLFDRHALSLYRAGDLPCPWLPAICGRGRGRAISTPRRRVPRRKRPPRRSPSRLEVFNKFYLGQNRIPLWAAMRPSIADIRKLDRYARVSRAAIDYPLPGLGRNYMGAVEKSLGSAYTPSDASDVRGYIAHVRSQRRMGFRPRSDGASAGPVTYSGSGSQSAIVWFVSSRRGPTCSGRPGLHRRMTMAGGRWRFMFQGVMVRDSSSKLT